MSLATSFLPIASPDARVLVLGSMPSIASLAKREYYGHPRNAFWAIMGRLFGASPELPYRQRQQILRARQIAVWDVLRECYREGSLDTSIDTASEVPNDFAAFFGRHPHLGTVFFNGLKAETAYRRHVLPLAEEGGRQFRYVRLPSTSPAHAGRSFDEKLAAWSEIRDALNGLR
jgi:double-stranded uracil-DNA glycosylase